MRSFYPKLSVKMIQKVIFSQKDVVLPNNCEKQDFFILFYSNAMSETLFRIKILEIDLNCNNISCCRCHFSFQTCEFYYFVSNFHKQSLYLTLKNQTFLSRELTFFKWYIITLWLVFYRKYSNIFVKMA